MNLRSISYNTLVSFFKIKNIIFICHPYIMTIVTKIMDEIEESISETICISKMVMMIDRLLKD